ncbi:MAG: leucyl aminopeptidase (aminopeptidase T) [Candidatus Azotimanducaceae bacterium]|jgi:leucyl aminopeptidase (aminopeptidase T)
MITVPDTTTGLKPEFIAAVDKIYREMVNLQPGTRVLIITDSRTPRHVVTVFMGLAMAAGAEVSVSENSLGPLPADQPAFKWNPMVASASRDADLIIDFAVGYADFIADAMARGAQVLVPGDGVGGHHIEDSLIRTILQADIHKLKRESEFLMDLFTNSKVVHMTSEDGTDFKIDIEGLQGFHSSEFLWDRDRNQKIMEWATLPPAAPGIVLPKGAGNGVVAVDSVMMLDDANYLPKSPVYLTFDKGKIVNAEGEDRALIAKMNRWLDSIEGDSGRMGPVHFNIGLNPNARLTEHQEFEKLRGSVVMGIGDSVMINKMHVSGKDLEPVVSSVHWDFIIMSPTVTLDGTVICENGTMPEFEG